VAAWSCLDFLGGYFHNCVIETTLFRKLQDMDFYNILILIAN